MRGLGLSMQGDLACFCHRHGMDVDGLLQVKQSVLSEMHWLQSWIAELNGSLGEMKAGQEKDLCVQQKRHLQNLFADHNKTVFMCDQAIRALQYQALG